MTRRSIVPTAREKTVFNQRRKMLRVSLKQIFDSNHPATPGFFDSPLMTMRPEQLSIAQFVDLTNAVAAALEALEK